MVNVRIKSLPAAATPNKNDLVPLDNATTRAATIEALVNAGRPFASQAEAEAGAATNVAMNPLTTKQALAAQGALLFQPFDAVLSATTASFTTGDEAKLDGIEVGADVTDAVNVAAAGAVMASDTSTAPMAFVIDEDNMASNSATKVPTQQSVKAYVDAGGRVGEPIIIYATGQSNLAQRPAFSWTPEPNAYEWNAEASGSTGIAFMPMPNSEMNWSQRFTSEIARANPGRNVYLIRMGGSGQPIAQWMVGAGAPDMYAIGKANIGAALSVLGKTTIDMMLWWQGESDAAAPSAYVANFETVINRHKTETWFPENTPIMVMGVSSEAISGNAIYRNMNSYLQKCVSADPERRTFFYTPGAVPAADWLDTLHLKASGHSIAGFAAANAWLNGTRRAVLPGLTVDPENIRYTFGDGIPGAALATWAKSQDANTQHNLAVNQDAGANADARAVVQSVQGSMTMRAYGAALTGSGALSWSGTGSFYIQATHATGVLRFSTGGLAEKMTLLPNGNLGIGESSPDYLLDVNGPIGFRPGASVTPVDNGDVVFQLTSNTQLTIKAKGADGTVRLVNLTLA